METTETGKPILEIFCELNGIDVPETIEDDILPIEIEGVPDIMIVQTIEGDVEVFAPIEGIDVTNPIALRALLEANHLGLATEDARIGIDPFNDDVSISVRWTAAELLEPDAPNRLAAFAGLVSGWRSEGVEAIAALIREKGKPLSDASSEMLIKV